MAEFTIRSALDSIEAAINRDEKGDALAVLQNARNVLTAADPVAPFEQQLRTELENADLAIDEIDSFIHVCNFALRHQDCDVDGDVAVVLNAAWDKVREARDRIQSAIDLLPEVCDGR